MQTIHYQPVVFTSLNLGTYFNYGEDSEEELKKAESGSSEDSKSRSSSFSEGEYT